VASLLDAGLALAELKKELKKIPLSGYSLSEKKEERTDPKIGRSRPARRFVVKTLKKERGRSFREIVSLVNGSKFQIQEKKKILAVFKRLAEAEKKVHGKVPDHFHQVGEIDSIVDIVSAVVGLRTLEVEKVYCSTVNLGSPAPATVLILKGFPVRIDANLPECTTPTAAAVLAEIAEFEPPPPFKLASAGAGTGSRSEPAPNILSFFLGETLDSYKEDEVLVLETNIDDMPPHAYETVFQKLQEAGCLDFILIPGLMKKSRPGQKLEVILKREKLESVLNVIFNQTSTFGVRVRPTGRIVLERETEEVKVRNRLVRIKIGRYRGRVIRVNPEYEDIRRVAEKEDLPLIQISDEAKTAFLKKRSRNG